MRDLLVIRADAGPDIGTGHVMRCLALAEAWRSLRGGEAVFAGRVEPAGLRERIEGAGFSVIMPEGSTAAAEAAWLAGFCRSTAAAWLVLDGYGFDPAYREGCRAPGCLLLVMDDLAGFAPTAADLLCNQNVYAGDLDYGHASGRLLLGPRYALLREDFRRQPPRLRSGRVERLLVSMGGADPENATCVLLAALDRLGCRDMRVKVVVGPANRYLREVEDLSRRVGYPCGLAVEPERMDRLIDWADAAVSAAGSGLYEFLAMGCPVAALVIAANQEMNCRAFSRCGLAWPLGAFSGGRVDSLASGLQGFLSDSVARQRFSAAGPRLVDGKGALRLVAEMTAPQLVVRDASLADAGTLLGLANDPLVRRNSFSTAVIGPDEHRRWLERRLADPACRIFLLTTPSGETVGVVRFEEEDGAAVVSAAIARRWRGLGLGPRAIAMACRRFEAGCGGELVALVRPENAASLAAFTRAGFEADGELVVRGARAVRLVRGRVDAVEEDGHVCHC